jgi:hypothetical protein
MLPRTGRAPIDGCQVLPNFSGVSKIDSRHGAAGDVLVIVALRAEFLAMTSAAIHVVPDDSFDDWVVRGDIGNEFGHYPTREAAELAAEAIARKREADLVVHLPDGRTSRTSFKKGWAARLFSR